MFLNNHAFHFCMMLGSVTLLTMSECVTVAFSKEESPFSLPQEAFKGFNLGSRSSIVTLFLFHSLSHMYQHSPAIIGERLQETS